MQLKQTSTPATICLLSTTQIESLCELLRTRLGSSAYAALRHLRCEPFDQGGIRVSGCVPSFFLKQMSQVLAETVCGHSVALVNDVEVRSPAISPR
jgi:hypothetical protein